MQNFEISAMGRTWRIARDADGKFIMPEELRSMLSMGSALKPAWEPIIMARKPLEGTVAANVLKHGTGALNIDACRVEGGARPLRERDHQYRPESVDLPSGSRAVGETTDGRWPANVIHDGSPAVLAAFPEAPGQLAGATAPSPKTSRVYGAMARVGEASADSENTGAVGFKMKPGARREDAGSAARFFYCAKTSKQDRNEGTEALPQRAGGMVSNTSGQHMTRRDGYEPPKVGNTHPTVKPTALMQYLVRLVTPPGGVVLDPYAGSGSTGKACMREGFDFIGCDMEQEHIDIANARISHEQQLVQPPAAPAQMDLLGDACPA